jgi:hypothetical protein
MLKLFIALKINAILEAKAEKFIVLTSKWENCKWQHERNISNLLLEQHIYSTYSFQQHD